MESVNNSKPGFFVQGRFLYTKDNEKVILRGVNHMFIWTDREGKSIPEIAKTGANCVRIVWNMHGRISDLYHIVDESIVNSMIPIVELHDATGQWTRLPELVNFWTREDAVQLIQDHQEYLLVNIGNEVGGEEESGEEFYEAYTSAVTRMRAAGIRVPLIIDADNWGQSSKNILEQGARLLSSDPEHNLIFDIHMWWPTERHNPEKTGYATVRERITGVLESVSRNLPLIIGEFAPVAVNGAREIPYKFIMAEAERLEIGWLSWSWGPGNFDSPEMDMTTHGSFNTLVGWGREVCVDSPWASRIRVSFRRLFKMRIFRPGFRTEAATSLPMAISRTVWTDGLRISGEARRMRMLKTASSISALWIRAKNPGICSFGRAFLCATASLTFSVCGPRPTGRAH